MVYTIKANLKIMKAAREIRRSASLFSLRKLKEMAFGIIYSGKDSYKNPHHKNANYKSSQQVVPVIINMNISLGSQMWWRKIFPTTTKKWTGCADLICRLWLLHNANVWTYLTTAITSKTWWECLKALQENPVVHFPFNSQLLPCDRF